MSGSDEDVYEYTAFKTEHRMDTDSPELYLLNADAYELTQWADVPRKGQDFMEGYQRQLDDERVGDIREYFEEDPSNIIPGSILVTVDEEFVEIDEDGDGTYSVTIQDTDEGDVESLIEQKFDQLYGRLGDEEKEYVDIDFDDGEDEGDSDEDEEPEEPIAPSYLARVTRQIKHARDNFDRLTGDQQDAVEQYVRSTIKPGLILDGQHRVWGASGVPEDIHLPVVLLPNLRRSEQVFHFYIVNNKAEPLTQEQLLITLATSLTEGEIEDLFDRLDSAGVDAEEARLAYRADTNPKSPFAGLVNYEGAVGEQTGAFRYKLLHHVIDNFVDMKSEYRTLYSDLPEWNSDEDFTYRLDRFYTFWNAIKENYSDLWEDAIDQRLGNEEFPEENPEQFIYRATMVVLQEYILDHMLHLNDLYVERIGTGPILGDDDTIEEVVSDAIEDIHSDFFRREWTQSSLDTSDGRELLKGQLNQADGLEPRYMHTLTLFRGS